MNKRWKILLPALLLAVFLVAGTTVALASGFFPQVNAQAVDVDCDGFTIIADPSPRSVRTSYYYKYEYDHVEGTGSYTWDGENQKKVLVKAVWDKYYLDCSFGCRWKKIGTVSRTEQVVVDKPSHCGDVCDNLDGVQEEVPAGFDGPFNMWGSMFCYIDEGEFSSSSDITGDCEGWGVDVSADVTPSGWTPTLFSDSGAWESEVESYNASVVWTHDTITHGGDPVVFDDPAHVYGGDLDKWDHCALSHTPDISVEYDECSGWNVVVGDDEGGVVDSYDPAQSGTWSKPNKLESLVVTVSMSWPDGHSADYEVEVNEPSICQATCPEGDGWVKIDGIDAQTYDYSAPEGKNILRTCYKAGTTVVYDPTSGQFSPPLLSYLFESEVPNPTGQAYLDISHLSVLLGKIPHEYGAELDVSNTCGGVLVEAVITDFGDEIDRFTLDNRLWSETYVLEEFGPKDYDVTLPDDSVVSLHLDMQTEPDDCQVAHEASTFLHNDCEEWEVGYLLDGVETIVASGSWDEPENGDEQDSFPAFSITVPEGEIVDISDPDDLMSGGTVDEPEDCYAYCSATSEPVYGEWSEWTLDPETGKEYRTRTVTIFDAEHEGYVCSEEVETEERWPRSVFNLTSMCRPDAESGQLRIRNNSPAPQDYVLRKAGEGVFDTGTAPVGDSFVDVPYDSSSDTWILEIAGFSFTKAIGDNPLCEAGYEVTKNDCDGWEVAEYLYVGGEGTVVDSGSWSDPYELEEAASHGFLIEEPSECQIFRTYKAHQAYLEDRCEGISRVINLYEGPANDPYRDLVGTLHNEVILFNDPDSLETIPADTIDVPEEYGEDYTFSAMVEPEVCHDFNLDYDQGADCEGYFRYVKVYDGGTLLKTLYEESGTWSDPFELEKGLPEDTIEVPDEYGYDISFLALNEPESCQIPHETKVWTWSNCEIWKVGYKLDGEKVTVRIGEWQDPYGPETVEGQVIVPIPEGELGKKLFDFKIVKDTGCIECQRRLVYYMTNFHPTDVPEDVAYWKGPFPQFTCPVIHYEEDETPSDQRVTMVCSLCDTQVPGGYIFDDFTQGKTGVLWAVTCYKDGRYVTNYVYLGHNWNEWERDSEFDPTGRICPRIDGCSDFIRENAPDIFPPEE